MSSHHKRSHFPQLMILLSTLFLLFVAGCGGGQSADNGEIETSASARRAAAVATMPSANFGSVGDQSGLTETVTLSDTAPVEDSGPDLALGERVYTNRCAECHGAQGEGDSASAVAGLTMEKADFVDLLRTGGDLGPDHLFGTRAVSENGLNAMFAYLQTLE